MISIRAVGSCGALVSALLEMHHSTLVQRRDVGAVGEDVLGSFKEAGLDVLGEGHGGNGAGWR
jgi:hypothetical protein